MHPLYKVTVFVSPSGEILLLYETMPESGAGPGSAEASDMAAAMLTVRHDSTEEWIQVELAPRAGPPIDLGARAHHVVLLELARARLDDRKQGVEQSQEGWIHRDELAQRTSLGINHINIMIFRIRQQVAEAGVPGAERIVERQPRLGMMRLGIRDVKVIRE